MKKFIRELFLFLCHGDNVMPSTLPDQLYKNCRSNKRHKKKKKLQAHRREIIFYQILQNMCGGYYKVSDLSFVCRRNLCMLCYTAENNLKILWDFILLLNLKSNLDFINCRNIF